MKGDQFGSIQKLNKSIEALSEKIDIDIYETKDYIRK